MTGSQAPEKPGGAKNSICHGSTGLHTSEFLKFNIVETAQIRAAIILCERSNNLIFLGLYFTTDFSIDVTDPDFSNPSHWP